MIRLRSLRTSWNTITEICGFLAITSLLSANPASAIDNDCIPGLPCPDETGVAMFPTGLVTLDRATELTFRKLTLPDGAKVKTNGYDLILKIEDDLVIEGEALIYAFDARDHPSAPPKVSKARNGKSFNSGPNTEGPGCRGSDCVGAAGDDGEGGVTGAIGNDGFNAGTIVVEVDGTFSGGLTIRNDGGIGGPGGPGGEGGDGGTGQQGGRGDPGLIDCSSGPGWGGNGGSGGAGGNGGAGGRGGDGGIVILRGIEERGSGIQVTVSGGQGGAGGVSGDGGNGGKPGFGGRGAGLCQGRETERMGTAGTPGAPGGSGPQGDSGREGRVVFLDE